MFISFERNQKFIEQILMYKYFMQSLSFRLCVNVMFKLSVTIFGGLLCVTARYYIIVMLKVNTSFSFCIYVNVCVDESRKKNIAMSRRATLLPGILWRHFTNRVLQHV